MKTCNVALIFESVEVILSCYHTNESNLFCSTFAWYQSLRPTKHGNFLELWLFVVLLGFKGLGNDNFKGPVLLIMLYAPLSVLVCTEARLLLFRGAWSIKDNTGSLNIFLFLTQFKITTIICYNKVICRWPTCLRFLDALFSTHVLYSLSCIWDFVLFVSCRTSDNDVHSRTRRSLVPRTTISLDIVGTLTINSTIYTCMQRWIIVFHKCYLYVDN